MKDSVWSPRPREDYTVEMPDGTRDGIGALEIFEGRPGLWNLVWLHSVRVDTILNWEGPPDEAPGYSEVIDKCDESAGWVVGGLTVEHAASRMEPQKFVNHLRNLHTYLPIQAYWDKLEGDSWEKLVEDRVKLSRLHVGREGNIYKPNFG